MSLLPILKPLESASLIRLTCQLYKRALLPALPVSLLWVINLYFILDAKHFLPPAWQAFHLKAAMVAVIFMVPLTAILIATINNTGKEHRIAFSTLILDILPQFLSLVGALLSILLLPAILLGIGVVGNLLLLKYQVTSLWVLAWRTVTLLIIYGSLVKKFFAITLVVIDKQDANSAVDKSDELVKGFYWRTFWHMLYGLLILILATKIPDLLHYYFSALKIPSLVIKGITGGMLTLLLPWSLSLLISHYYDLSSRLQTRIKDSQPRKANGPPLTHKGTKSF